MGDEASQEELNEHFKAGMADLYRANARIEDLEKALAAVTLALLKLVSPTLGLQDEDLSAFLRARSREVDAGEPVPLMDFPPGEAPLAKLFAEVGLTLAPPRPAT